MFGIVCALPCEAEPLLHHFCLSLKEPKPFPLYQNETIALVVSGVGKVAAAAATSYLLTQITPSVCLNIGIAGHRSLPIGSSLLAHQVIDATTQRKMHPTFTFSPPCCTQTLCTIDSPPFSMNNLYAYDQEASAFFTTASHWLTNEKIHCWKVVSDHGVSLHQRLSKTKIAQWIGDAIGDIDNLLLSFSSVNSEREPLLSLIAKITKQCHFTTTEKHRLQTLLTQWQACRGLSACWQQQWDNCSSSKHFLKAIQLQIDQTPLIY